MDVHPTGEKRTCSEIIFIALSTEVVHSCEKYSRKIFPQELLFIAVSTEVKSSCEHAQNLSTKLPKQFCQRNSHRIKGTVNHRLCDQGHCYQSQCFQLHCFQWHLYQKHCCQGHCFFRTEIYRNSLQFSL